MIKKFTAVYKKTGKWYSAWVEEVPGANTQGKTLKEAKANETRKIESIKAEDAGVSVETTEA